MLLTVDTTLELAWNAWLSRLSPWELHWLCQHGREMRFHDDFVSGDLSLEQIEETLASAFAG